MICGKPEAINNMKTFSGKRLKSARIYNNLNVVELAEKLGLQRQTVSMYENGKLNTPNWDIVRMMSNVLDFPTDFFLEDDAVPVKLASTYFRSLMTTNKKYRNEQIEKAGLIAQIFAFLQEYVQFPSLDLPPVENLSIEESAARLREYWELGTGPIDHLVYHVEQHGIIVTTFDSSSDTVDAFSQMVDISSDTRYLIGYSKNKNAAARVHFDISHELGHILLHEWSEDIESLSKEQFMKQEREAHQFAAAFLLPQESFLKDLGIYADKLGYYERLKNKWKVSMAAMIRRAYDLEAISYTTYQSLMKAMQKKGIRKQEPLDEYLITSAPSLLTGAVKLLLSEKVFTPKAFMDALSDQNHLSLTPKIVEDLLNLPRNILQDDCTIPSPKLTVINRKL